MISEIRELKKIWNILSNFGNLISQIFETVGWYRQLSGHEYEQTLGDGEGQGSLVHCSPWGRKVSGTAEWLNNAPKSLVCKEIKSVNPDGNQP